MKLSLDTRDVNKLQEIIASSLGENIEVEWRLGSYRNGFIPGLSENTFYTLIQKLKSQVPGETETSTVEYFGKVRKIGDIYQLKTKLKSYDIDFAGISTRISVSTEENTTQPLGGATFKRERIRQTFNFPEYKVELSRVSSNNQVSFEVEIEFIQKHIQSLPELLAPLKHILSLIFPDKIALIKQGEYIDILKYYNGLFRDWAYEKGITIENNKVIRYENRPRNIKRDDPPYMNKYSVTNKLNGVGFFLVVAPAGVYLINQTEVDKIAKPNTNYIGTVLHGELFEGRLHIFDTTRFRGKDVAYLPHPKRLDFAKEIILTLEASIDIVIKKFILTGNLKQDTLDILQYMRETWGEDMEKKNDGLMYTPINMHYINIHTLKWKFPHTLTIDFLVDNPSPIEGGILYNLKVYNSQQRLVPFQYQGKTYKLKVARDNPLSDTIVPGVIVEAEFNVTQNIFLPQRVRHDKNRPNFVGVANDVFTDIINPLTLEELLGLFDKLKPQIQDGECLIPMRKYHNLEKRKLILNYTKDKTVLDLGFGRGGDIHKYHEAGVTFIWGVEPDKDNYEEARRRIAEKEQEAPGFQSRVQLIQLEAQKSGDIMDIMKGKNKMDVKAEVVASFFSLTFFFKSEYDLDRLVNTVAQTVIQNGYFIGTTMDGEATYNILKGKKELLHSGCFNIKKFYQDDDTPNIGNKIIVHLSDTIVTEQEEYLVWWSIFVSKMEKRGLVLLNSEMFRPPETMRSEVRKLSSLFRSFVFQRQLSSSERISIARNMQDKQRQAAEYLNRLKPADIDVNLTFDNNITDAQLVRTGTVSDGSCFVHSILRSVDQSYGKKTLNEKQQAAADLRRILSDRLEPERWASFGSGSVAYTMLTPAFLNFVKKHYSKDYDAVTKLTASDILAYRDVLPSHLVNVYDEFIRQGFEGFKKLVKRCDVWVGEDSNNNSVNLFEYLADYLNIDLYIIHDATREAYKKPSKCELLYKDRASVVILWVDNSHYEAVGRLEKDGSITRVFTFNDGLIQTLRKSVC